VDRQIVSDANVFSIQFSPDGAVLHGLCADVKLRTWDAATAALRSTLPLDAAESSPLLTPHGVSTLGKDGALRFRDLATGKLVKTIPAGRHGRRAIGNDGAVFLSEGRTEIQLRSVAADGKQRYAVPAGLGGLGALAISPDGTSVVAASYDADLRAWNARNGELLRLVDELPVAMFALQFSPDGSWLAAAGADRILYLFDAKTWQIRKKITGQPEMISALAISPDGSKAVTGGFDAVTLKNPVKVILWDLATGKAVRTVDAPQRVSAIAYAPDGKSFAVSTATKTIQLWQVPA
jgi:WD40 repeat protein